MLIDEVDHPIFSSGSVAEQLQPMLSSTALADQANKVAEQPDEVAEQPDEVAEQPNEVTGQPDGEINNVVSDTITSINDSNELTEFECDSGWLLKYKIPQFPVYIRQALEHAKSSNSAVDKSIRQQIIGILFHSIAVYTM